MRDEKLRLEAPVPMELAGLRLDQALAQLFPDYSRARLSDWVREGRVMVNDKAWRPRDKVFGGEHITLEVVIEVKQRWEAQPIPLDIVYEDESILVVNKPAGLVAHPAVGNPNGTLLNALLHHAPEVASVPRAGIVHRLDKGTTGLLVVARTLEAQTSLVQQLQAREFLREYEAVINGVLTGGGKVDAPIGRHPVDRKRMAVVPSGKPAVTHYRVVERFFAHTHTRLRLETGRTHQIRVHMAHIRYPLVGDSAYGGRLRLPPQCSPELAEGLRGFKRQALHAARLGIVHPRTGESMEWQAEIPADMARLLKLLHDDTKKRALD